MDRSFRRIAGLTAALTLLAWPAFAWSQPHGVMATWHPWQLDSILVAWVLGKAAAPPTAFESLPRGTPIDAERAIDTPDSPYRRSAQRTAFEEALRLSGYQDACVPRLREAVRVVELAPWHKPDYPRVESLEALVLRALPSQPMRGGLDAAMAEIDRYCRDTTWKAGR